MANILFLRQEILEELEVSNKGTISKDQVLSLQNGLKYKLEAAIMIQTELSNNKAGKKYEGRIVTMREIEDKGCDLYMQTIIIDDFAFNVIEGFRAVLIKKKKNKVKKKLNTQSKNITEERKKIKKMQETLKKEKERFEQEKSKYKDIPDSFKDEVTEIDFTKSEKDEVSDFILKF